MAPTNRRSLGQGDALRLSDQLLQLQPFVSGKTFATTGLTTPQTPTHAPNHAQWRAQLHRLLPLEADLALLPVGWGAEQKGPMLEGWQHHGGFTVAQLQQHRFMRSVGARTGLLTGPLLAFDFDGETAFSLGLQPSEARTWQVHRTTDPWRLKVMFRPTLEQLMQLPGGAEFHGKTVTAAKTDTAKAQALEVFFDGGCQMVVLGEHPSSKGYYFWPDGMGPEALAAPPEQWWLHALQIAEQCRSHKATGSKPSTNRHGTRRLNPCPICGRHGRQLWCEQTQRGLILCMPGSTFSAEGRHGRLRIGQVIDGWALVKRTPISEGDVLAFKRHQPKGVSHG